MSARIRLAFAAFAGIAALLLVYEHRAHVLTGTGILIGLLALCIGMHLFMHHRPLAGEREPRDPEAKR